MTNDYSCCNSEVNGQRTEFEWTSCMESTQDFKNTTTTFSSSFKQQLCHIAKNHTWKNEQCS